MAQGLPLSQKEGRGWVSLAIGCVNGTDFETIYDQTFTYIIIHSTLYVHKAPLTRGYNRK